MKYQRGTFFQVGHLESLQVYYITCIHTDIMLVYHKHENNVFWYIFNTLSIKLNYIKVYLKQYEYS